MKRLSIYAAMLLSMAACTKETVTYHNPVPGENEKDIIAELSIGSRNTLFSTDDGVNAAVAFKSLGGEVVIDVNTNVSWDCKVSGDDFVEAVKDETADQLVLSCPANKNEKKLSASVEVTAGDKTAVIEVVQNAYGTLEIAASQNNFRIPAVGDLAASFSVTSSDENWTFETVACEWMFVERNGNELTLSVDPNVGLADRETVITLIAGLGGATPVTEKVSILQDRAANISVGAQTIPFAPTSDSEREVSVSANFDWEYEVDDPENGWLTVERTENGLRITPVVNSGEESRVVAITVRTGDGKDNVDEKVITVSQTGMDLNAFIVGLNVEAKNLTSILFFGKGFTGTIDWGDGTVEEVDTDTYPSHTYTDPNEYIVSAKGSAPAMYVQYGSYYDQKAQVVRVYNWGRLGVGSMKESFRQCGNLTTVPEDNCGAFKNVTTFEYAFAETGLASVPEGLFRYAENLTNAENMFYASKEISSVPADLLYNSPKLTTIKGLFSQTSLAEIDKDFISKNTELTDVSQMFSNCRNLSSIPAGFFDNNTKVTTCNALFAYCSSLESIPEGLFDHLTECTNFRMTFHSTALSEVPKGLFAHNTKCTTFDNTFNSTKLVTVPEDLFAGCSQVVKFMSCFASCSELKSIPAGLFTNSGAFNTALDKTAFNMVFQRCTSLESVPAGLFDGFTKITQFNSIFNGCSSLRSVPSGLFATNVNVSQMSSAFAGCVSLEEVPDEFFKGLAKVTSFASMFDGCTGLRTVGSDVFAGCTACTNISSMFKGCTSLENVSETAFSGMAKVSNISGIFLNCTSLKTVPAGIFSDLVALTNASNAFSGSGLVSAPAGLFANNPKITNFATIFKDCTNLVSAGDGLFAGAVAATSFKSAFDGCTSLETVGNIFGTSTIMANIACDLLFNGCTSLKEIPSGLFDGLKSVNTFASTFAGCTSLASIPSGLFANQTIASTLTLQKCFSGCASLLSIPDNLFGAADRTNISTCLSMFEKCTSLSSVETNSFNVLKRTAGTTMTSLFEGCTAVTSVPDGLFKETVGTFSNVFKGCTSLRTVGSEVFNGEKPTALANLFVNCTSLNDVSANMFCNVSGVTSISGIFDGCSSLRTIPAGLFDGMAKVNNMSNLFRGCASLSSVSKEWFKDITLVTNVSAMFSGCTALVSFPVDFFDNMVKITNVGNLFNGCSGIVGESPYTIVNGAKVHIYERTNAASTGMASIATATSSRKGCFAGCTGMTDFASIPDTWK